MIIEQRLVSQEPCFLLVKLCEQEKIISDKLLEQHSGRIERRDVVAELEGGERHGQTTQQQVDGPAAAAALAARRFTLVLMLVVVEVAVAGGIVDVEHLVAAVDCVHEVLVGAAAVRDSRMVLIDVVVVVVVVQNAHSEKRRQ